MKKKLAAQMIELTQDACLSAFNRKTVLTTFLRQHNIPQNYPDCHTDETKRQYLDKLFCHLISLKDNEGHAIILEIAHSLSSKTSFPDLENWEDSSTRLDKARCSINRLKREVSKIDQQVIDEKEKKERHERARNDKERIQRESHSLQKLYDRLNSLSKRIGEQKAGYDFEEWFYDLAIFSEILARRSYRDPDGRQIDGSLTIDGTTFLIETKFSSNPSGSEDIDIFSGKVENKIDNTMGIMIAISGYNENAKKNASKKRIILLLDHSHIYNLILNGLMSLTEVIQRAYRHAGQTGDSFLHPTRFSG